MIKAIRLILLALPIGALVLLAVPMAGAGDIILSNNSGDGNDVFFISGEPSLVINGFDLTPLGVQMPATLDRVNISVKTPAPGAPVEVVVYQDANGGSPIDSELVGRATTTIDNAGVFSYTFDPPLLITQPVVWVGFYLPVGLEFYADNSGTSVLTWWAWTTGSTFDVSSLANAEVLGPADGSDPVGIDMGGVARITAELKTANGQDIIRSVSDVGTQLVSDTPFDIASVLLNYEFCGPVYYDPEDLAGDFTVVCRSDTHDPLAPTEVIPSDKEFERRGYLFDIMAFGEYRAVPNDAEWLRRPVTHCIRPRPEDLEQAVIGSAYGAPRVWHILPTVRFGEFICAEVTNTGYLSYFVPRAADITDPKNLNLQFAYEPVINPHPLQCGSPAEVRVSVINNGPDATDRSFVVSVTDVLASTGQILATSQFVVPTLAADEAYTGTVNLTTTTFTNELHSVQVTIDSGNYIPELNESDNFYSSEYLLGQGICGSPSNSNLEFEVQPVIDPHPLVCGQNSTITIKVKNTGTERTPAPTRMSIVDTLVSTGQVQAGIDVTVPELNPNEVFTSVVLMNVSTYYNEMHRTTIRLDADSGVIETDETDNLFEQNYVLQQGSCP